MVSTVLLAPPGRTILVKAGGNFQGALNKAAARPMEKPWAQADSRASGCRGMEAQGRASADRGQRSGGGVGRWADRGRAAAQALMTPRRMA